MRKTSYLALLAATMMLCFQNCSNTHFLAETNSISPPSAEPAGKTLVADVSYDQITHPNDGFTFKMDLNKGEASLKLSKTYIHERSCYLSATQISELRSYVSAAKVCEVVVPKGALVCMAYSIPDYQLLNTSNSKSVTLVPKLCGQGVYLCKAEKEDQSFRKLAQQIMKDLKSNTSVFSSCMETIE